MVQSPLSDSKPSFGNKFHPPQPSTPVQSMKLRETVSLACHAKREIWVKTAILAQSSVVGIHTCPLYWVGVPTRMYIAPAIAVVEHHPS